jgi:tetratricopeptide (TPR) repeat protein
MTRKHKRGPKGPSGNRDGSQYAQVVRLIEETERNYGSDSIELARVFLKLGLGRVVEVTPGDAKTGSCVTGFHLVTGRGAYLPLTQLSLYIFREPSYTVNRLELVESVLRGALERFSANNLDEFRSAVFVLLDVSEHFEAAGMSDRSTGVLELLADSCRRNLDPTDSVTANVLMDLGVRFQQRGNWKQAEELFAEALEKYETDQATLVRYGPRALMNLAVSAFHRRDFSKGEEHVVRALGIVETAEEPDQGHLMELLLHLAQVRLFQGKFDDLEAITLGIREDARYVWEQEPELVIEIMLDLIRLLEGYGKFGEADEIMTDLSEKMDSLTPKLGGSKHLQALTKIFIENLRRKGAPRCLASWKRHGCS